MRILVLATSMSLFSSFAFASDKCVTTAVHAVKTQAVNAHSLSSVVSLKPRRNYLELYEVTLVDNIKNPAHVEVYRVELMKSYCTVISLLPKW